MVKDKKVRFFEGFEFDTWVQAIVSVIAVIMVVGGVLGGTIYLMVSNAVTRYAYSRTVTYYVEQGDTLWTIAQGYSDPKNQDVRRVIDIIEDINDCTADIYPGDALEIPVFDCLGG